VQGALNGRRFDLLSKFEPGQGLAPRTARGREDASGSGATQRAGAPAGSALGEDRRPGLAWQQLVGGQGRWLQTRGAGSGLCCFACASDSSARLGQSAPRPDRGSGRVPVSQRAPGQPSRIRSSRRGLRRASLEALRHRRSVVRPSFEKAPAPRRPTSVAWPSSSWRRRDIGGDGRMGDPTRPEFRAVRIGGVALQNGSDRNSPLPSDRPDLAIAAINSKALSYP